jgi:hypothetical protein
MQAVPLLIASCSGYMSVAPGAADNISPKPWLDTLQVLLLLLLLLLLA